jgi:hypothetical protein
MKTKNLIYLGIGGVIAYYLFKKSSDKQQQDLPQEEEPQGGVIQGVFVGGKPYPTNAPTLAQERRKPRYPFFRWGNRNQQVQNPRQGLYDDIVASYKRKPKEIVDKEIAIDVRKGRVSNVEPNLYGVNINNKVNKSIKKSPIDVYYANLVRITPLEVFTPVRYKEKISGTSLIGNIYVSSIDENNNMIWKNEKTGQLVNIIYPTR